MPKNRFEIVKEGKVIKIKITASSEKMADGLFDAIDLLAVEGLRIDLEQEWNNK